jgi:hypothetical protein
MALSLLWLIAPLTGERHTLHYQRKKTTMEKIGIAEIVTVIESSEWNEYLTTWQYDAVLELAEYVRESQIIINGLLGAMTPKQKHRQWPNLTKRAKCLLIHLATQNSGLTTPTP